MEKGAAEFNAPANRPMAIRRTPAPGGAAKSAPFANHTPSRGRQRPVVPLALPTEQLRMFALPFSSMFPVFSNNHSELNAGALVSGIARPVQAKQ
jgi:hypothetical protein